MADFWTSIEMQGSEKELLSLLKIVQKYVMEKKNQYRKKKDCDYLDEATIGGILVKIFRAYLKTSYRFLEESSAWSEDFIKKLPFGKFKKLFKISGEDFDKEAYAEIVSAIEEDYYEAIDTLDYDDFVSYLEDYDAETDLDDEKFADNYSDGKEKVITYDPVKKEYVK